jgi:hypothetical protein
VVIDLHRRRQARPPLAQLAFDPTSELGSLEEEMDSSPAEPSEPFAQALRTSVRTHRTGGKMKKRIVRAGVAVVVLAVAVQAAVLAAQANHNAQTVRVNLSESTSGAYRSR